MKVQQIHEHDGLRTLAVVFGTGDEVAEGLRDAAVAHGLTAAQITGVGAFSHARLGYFDLDAKEYLPIEVGEQVEVLSFLGNVACTAEGETKVHAHVVVGRRDGSAAGGHLLGATVRPTLELVVTETPAHLRRELDPETGLPLLAR
jgi:predicted DNA-binding protein with PD1-like motif